MKMQAKIKAKNNYCILRNEAIIFRYYFYFNTIGLKKEKVIEQLSVEYFISECTIQEIISDNKKFLKEVIEKEPDLKFLKKKFPFLKWDKKHIFADL